MKANDARRVRSAIARFQRLCCLGLDEQAAMPVLIEAVTDLVPASTAGLMLASEAYGVRSTYFEGSFLEVTPVYFAEFVGKRGQEVVISFADSFRRQSLLYTGNSSIAIVDRKEFIASDYYNEILKPGKIEQPLYLNFFNGKKPGGLLMMSREAGCADFTSVEQAIVGSFGQFISHALHGGVGAGPYVESEDRTMAILDRDGRLLASSPEVRRLLMMALVPEWRPSAFDFHKLEDLPELAACCRQLGRALEGEAATAPPVIRRRNAWGVFVLRAYPIHLGDARGAFGLTIERWEPRVAALLRVIERLPLTEREKDLCLALAQGRDAVGAATAMGISENTVIAHRRNVYRKLGVSSRSGLIDRLQFDMEIDVGEAWRSAPSPTRH